MSVDGGVSAAGPAGVGIRPATVGDLPAVLTLLESLGLPTVGVAESLGGFVIATGAGALLGMAGLELHGRDAVLRSVAVDPAARGVGLGARLTERVIDDAGAAGARRLYLLTTTAADYFPRHGFRRIGREEASPEVRRSVEFQEACPASAVAMALDLE